MSSRRQIFDALTEALDVLAESDPQWEDPLTGDELTELGARSLEIAVSVAKLSGLDVFTFSGLARAAFLGGSKR